MKLDAATGNVSIATDFLSIVLPQYLLTFQAEYVTLSREISIFRGLTTIWAIRLPGTSYFRTESYCFLFFSLTRVAVYNSVDRVLSSRISLFLLGKLKWINLLLSSVTNSYPLSSSCCRSFWVLKWRRVNLMALNVYNLWLKWSTPLKCRLLSHPFSPKRGHVTKKYVK